MNPNKRRISRLAVLATTAAVGINLLGALPASANPGDGSPGGAVGEGIIGVTGVTNVREGQRISFAGSGFASASGVFQKLNVKLDAYSSTSTYAGSANDELATLAGVKPQVQADGTVSGSFVVPADIDDVAVNPDSAAGPHFVRVLAGTPATSRWTQHFTVAADAPLAPSVAATSAYAGRGGTFTITVSGSGFAANETISVARATGWNSSTALTWATGGTTDGSGNLTGTITPGNGAITAGEHQLVLTGATSTPATAQLLVAPRITVANLAQDTDGTLTLVNTPVGTEISSVRIDNDGDVATNADQVEIAPAPITVDTAASDSGALHVPATQAPGYGKTIVVTQTKPYTATYLLTSKVSPSAAPLDVDGYARVESAAGDIKDGLYQSAYSAAADALFATTAYNTTATVDDATQGWDGYLYKLDPDTLAVEAKVRAPFVSGSAGARFAPYGVGVDDDHGTVWVTNTRQNTVTVYDQATLAVLAVNQGTVSHSRDALYDPTTGLVFVTSASEGSSGAGYVSVFEADDKDGDGTKYEKVKDIGVQPRTVFSPMSLERDPETGRIYTTSLQTSKAMEIDPTKVTTTTTTDDTAAWELIDLPGLDDLGTRGASGIAVDTVTDRLFIVAQDNDLLLITNLDGSTIAEVPIGAGALNVSFDAVNRLVYVANFGGTTVSVTDVDGNIVANLPFTRPNHLAEDGKGSVFAVNKDSGNKVIKLTPKVASGTPRISGTARVGARLTAAKGTWEAGSTLTYRWLRNGTAISGASASTYTLAAADRGRKISVRVTGTKTGKASVSVVSAQTKAVVAGVLTAPVPKISGTPRVGRILTVKPGTWTSGTSRTYRWYANGKAITGGTKASIRLTKALRGKRITVTVTGKKAGYTTLTRRSAATRAVTR